jgi:uncharacterized membrane protein
LATEPSTKERDAEAFEFEVGQNWFAKVGILVLAIGVAFALAQPFASLPAAAPSLVGYAVAAGLFLVAHLWRKAFQLVSTYFRGAGMALLYFATLRLFFFGAERVFSTESLAGRGLLLLAVGVNLVIAFRRKSPYLVSLALGTGFVTAIVVGSSWFLLVLITLLSGLAVFARLRHNWPGLVFVGIGFTYFTYGIWAINNPFLGGAYGLVKEPSLCLGFVLLNVIILAAGPIFRREHESEDAATIVSALLNCGLGYGVFCVHSLVFSSIFVPAHAGASLVFLGLAIVCWLREHSRMSTFLYAMTGYMALSFAIIKAAAVPEVFVWLSLQSLVVVTTAIWFRSRFIVVANFLIYVAVVAGYVMVAKQESGISLGFGIVALVTARILNWKKDRLELKTELMRNAYLASAFVVFPYALYHLVPAAYVGLAWVGVALFYYGMNLVVRNRKYRWMGHATLLLTALYLLIVGTRQFEPVYRILSFLVLGTVLLVVSLIFTRAHGQSRAKE